jgi:pyridoxal phosphate enzyme (YggS family)
MPDTATMEIESSAQQTLLRNFEKVRRRVRAACGRAGRSADEVRLIAVSKTHPVEAIRALYDAGQRDFGESYVQEWREKAGLLADGGCDEINWHFIGHLQSNKAKYIANEVALIHSVDRKSVMKTLQKRSSEPVDVLLEVNIARQESKGGVAPDEVLRLLETAGNYPDLRVRGLMCIPPYVENPEDNRPHFRRMREIFEQARDLIQAQDAAARFERSEQFDHFSMGMSGDFEVAIEEGAVRVGTAIFGARDYDK